MMILVMYFAIGVAKKKNNNLTTGALYITSKFYGCLINIDSIANSYQESKPDGTNLWKKYHITSAQ